MSIRRLIDRFRTPFCLLPGGSCRAFALLLTGAGLVSGFFGGFAGGAGAQIVFEAPDSPPAPDSAVPDSAVPASPANPPALTGDDDDAVLDAVDRLDDASLGDLPAPPQPAGDLAAPADPAEPVGDLADPAEADASAGSDGDFVPDAALMAPLAPLAEFDPSPIEGLDVKAVAESAMRYGVTVSGLQDTGTMDDFRRLSALYRGAGKEASAAQIASRTRADEVLAGRLMTSEGWFDGEVDSDMRVSSNGKADDKAEVTLTVTPGERYRWRRITLDLIPADKPELAAGFGLHVGAPIRAAEVEEAEGALLKKLLDSGYPFAEIGVRDVVLDADAPTGTYFLTGDTGPEGVFGGVRMRGFKPFSERHATVIARFAPGQRFETGLVDDFRRALIATQQFGGVTVTTSDTGERDDAGRAITAINVLGNRGPLHQLIGQLGYSTGEGFRAEALWRNRAMVRPEGMFTARAVAGTQEQRVATQLTFGNWHQRDRTLDLGIDVAHLNRPAYDALQATLGAYLKRTSTPIWQKLWTWSLGAELIATREREQLVVPPATTRLQRDFLIAALPMLVLYDRSDDLLDPTRGFRLGLSLSPELSQQGGRTSYYGRIIANASYYQSVSDSLVLAARGRLGSILGADNAEIAPTRRFFAGGGGSVRGYDYQSIGPKTAAGDPAGGRGLTELGVEARYRFGDFGVVGFLDAGTVNDDPAPTLRNVRYGAGVGVRYYTAFGPMRADIARALNRGPHDPPLAIYISIGQAF